MYLDYVIVKALGDLFPMNYSFPLSGTLAGIIIGLLLQTTGRHHYGNIGYEITSGGSIET